MKKTIYFVTIILLSFGCVPKKDEALEKLNPSTSKEFQKARGPARVGYWQADSEASKRYEEVWIKNKTMKAPGMARQENNIFSEKILQYHKKNKIRKRPIQKIRVPISAVLHEGTGYVIALFANTSTKTYICEDKEMSFRIRGLNGVKVSDLEFEVYGCGESAMGSPEIYAKFKYTEAKEGKVQIESVVNNPVYGENRKIIGKKENTYSIVEIPVPFNPYFDKMLYLKASPLGD